MKLNSRGNARDGVYLLRGVSDPGKSCMSWGDNGPQIHRLRPGESSPRQIWFVYMGGHRHLGIGKWDQTLPDDDRGNIIWGGGHCCHLRSAE